MRSKAKNSQSPRKKPKIQCLQQGKSPFPEPQNTKDRINRPTRRPTGDRETKQKPPIGILPPTTPQSPETAYLANPANRNSQQKQKQPLQEHFQTKNETAQNKHPPDPLAKFLHKNNLYREYKYVHFRLCYTNSVPSGRKPKKKKTISDPPNTKNPCKNKHINRPNGPYSRK